MIIHSFPSRVPIRFVLVAVAALALAGLAITLTRVPVPRNDSQLYASIARSRQLVGVGVPSMLWSSPSPVDHIPFYGPVFFDLQATAFRLFGVSLVSSKLVSLFGALLLCAGGALLAARLSHSTDRWMWAFTLLLLTPEIASAATRGDMASLAVGFEVLALAIFVAGLAGGRRADWHGAVAGGLLMLAALTTPRTYPFVCAFVVSGIWLFLIRGRHPDARRQFMVSMAVLVAGMGAWSTWSQGNPVRWVRFIAYIFTHEDTDVAVLPSAMRSWQFSWSIAITPFVAAAGAVVAAAAIRRVNRQTSDEATRAITFALLVAGIGGVVTFVGMNLTFLWGAYFALPLFAVVLALPYRDLRLSPRLMAIALGLLLVADLGASAMRYARAAVTWNARNPAAIARLVQDHVPPGEAVVGPQYLYFFAVEGSGARYVDASGESVADWTRWVPLISPAAANVKWTFPAVPRPAFLIWAEDEEIPGQYVCALDHLIALYRPPPQRLDRLGRFGEVWDAGYPVTMLYGLPPGCPTRDE